MNPQTLTQEQIEQIRVLKAQGKSLQEVKSYLAASALGTSSSIGIERGEVPSITENPWQKKSLAESAATGLARTALDLPQDVTALGRDLIGVGKNVAGGVKDSFTREGISPISRVSGAIGSVVGAIPGVAGATTIGAARTVVPPSVEQATSETIGAGVQQAIESETGRGIKSWFDSQDAQTQFNIERLILPAADLVTTAVPAGFLKGRIGRPNIAKVEAGLADVEAKAVAGNIKPAITLAEASGQGAEIQKFKDNLFNSYQSSFIENRQSINNKLDDIARQQSFGDTKVTRDDLVRMVADEGIVPEIEDQLGRFSKAMDEIGERQDSLMKDLMPVVQNNRNTVDLTDLQSAVKSAIESDPRVLAGKGRALSLVDELFTDYRRQFGQTARAQDVLAINRNVNAITKSFDRDSFAPDTAYYIGKTARQWLDENVPESAVREANAEWGRLETVKRVVDTFDNQRVDVGMLGRTIGSYITVLGGSGIGAVAAGPGGLVTAGLLSKVGADFIADAMRKKMFNPKDAERIRQIIQSNNKLQQKLRDTAKTQDAKNFLDDLAGYKMGEQPQLPPAPEGAPRSSISSGAPIKVGQAGSAAPEGQVLESVREGAIKQPGGEGKPLPRSMYPEITEAELQKLKTSEFRKLLENVGVDVDEVAKAITGGTIGALLLLYMEDDGSMLPAFGAVIGMTASKGAKLTMLDEALKANNMRREALMKAGMTNSSSQIKTLEKQAQALAKEKADILGKAEGATPQTTALLEEAKKYKSAEEFIKAQKPLYHGTNAKFDKFDSKKVGSNTGEANAIGTFFAENTNDVNSFKDTLETGFGRGETRSTKDWRVIERYIPPNAKVFNLNLSGRGVSIKEAEVLAKFVGSESGEVLTGMRAKMYIDELVDESVPGEGIREIIFENADEFKRLLSEEGYIGYTDVMGKGAKEFIVFDPEKYLVTKSQLEDIWKQANESD